MSSVERPRQDAVGERSANEQDPELGQKRRRKRQTSHCYHGHKGEVSGAVSSGSSSSSSEGSNSSGSDGAGSSSRSVGTTYTHLHPRGEDNPDATRWQSGRDQPDTFFSKSGGPRVNDNSRSPATGQGFHEGARRSRRSRRHGNRRKGKTRTRELESRKRHRAVTPMTAKVFASLGRQTVENAVRTTVRAVLGGWKGMATAALRAIRKWQV